MKGMLYSSLLRNRSFILGAGIYTAAATVVGLALIFIGKAYPGIMPTLLILLTVFPAISIVFAIECVDRELENSLKTRFVNYIMAAVTPREFALAELLKNLLLTAYGIMLSLFMCLVYLVAGEGFFKISLNGDYFTDKAFLVAMPLLGIVCSLIQWTIIPLVIRFKSSEKAGMVVGPVIGLLIVAPVTYFSENPLADTGLTVFSLVEMPTALYIAAGVLLMYGLFWLILEKRLERGNIC